MAIKYKLKENENHLISYYLYSHNHYTHDLMSKEEALSIINNGEVSASDKINGFPLCVDEKYFIATDIWYGEN